MDHYNIGLVGLGTMGMNLALNIESKGFSVAGFDLDPEKMKHCGQRWATKNMTGRVLVPGARRIPGQPAQNSDDGARR